MRTLVSTEELARHPEWRVFDCQFDLAQPALGEQHYAAEHIPAAMYAHLERDLSGAKTGANGRHPLPDPAAFIAWLGQQGLQPSDQIVCYDEAPGIYAARLWWMLRWVGHDRVAVLDGGIHKWEQERRPTTAAVPRFAPATYPGRPRTDMYVDTAYVEAHLDDRGVRIIDARNTERFAGLRETLDPVGGHIPGALNRFFGANLDSERCFKPPAVLREEFLALLGETPASKVIQQCGSGVTACHNLLAMEHAGLAGSRLYPGSWSEWCADPRRPVAR